MAAISPALLTQRPHQAKSERQRATPSAPSALSAPRSPRSPIAPPAAHTAPLPAAHAALTAPPSEHTHLESPCRRAAAPSKPNFHHLHYDTTLPAIRAIRIIRVPDCFTRPAIRAPAACVAPHKFAIFRLFWNLSAPPFTKILHFYFATAFIFTNFAADLFITHI